MVRVPVIHLCCCHGCTGEADTFATFNMPRAAQNVFAAAGAKHARDEGEAEEVPWPRMSLHFDVK